MFGRLSKIEKAYRRYLSAPLFARFASTHLDRGDTERALAVCLEGCERFPDYPTGFYLLGRCYQALGDLEEARAALDKSLRLDAENPRGFELIAQIYGELGIPTLALRCMEEAALLDPFDESIKLQVEELSAQETSAPADTETRDPVDVEPPAEPSDATTDGESGDDRPQLMDTALSGEGEAGPPVTPAADVLEESESAPEPESVPESDPEPEQDPPTEVESMSVLPSEPETESVEVGAVDEPFGTLQDLPEWETQTPSPQHAEPAPMDPEREPAIPELDASDEVDALGAELFGDELPPPPEEAVRPPSSEPTALPTGRADSVSTVEVADTVGASPGKEESPSVADGDGVDELDPVIPGPAEPMPQPAADSPVSSDSVDAVVPDDEYAVSRFSKRGDAEMADLLRQIDCAEADEQEGADEDLPGPIPTTTLAELYSVQGFVDRAIETYRQVLLTQPSNEEAQTRLAALEHKD